LPCQRGQAIRSQIYIGAAPSVMTVPGLTLAAKSTIIADRRIIRRQPLSHRKTCRSRKRGGEQVADGDGTPSGDWRYAPGPPRTGSGVD